MTTTPETLALCPFCGSDPSLDDHRTVWVVRCKCGACILGERSPEPDGTEADAHWGRIKQTAVDAWNKRAQAAHGVPSRELSGWCQYVGGMVSGYIRMTGPEIASMDDDKLTAAVAGIIERRFWAMPAPVAAPQPSGVPDFLDDTDVARIYRQVYGGNRWSETERMFAAEIEAAVRERFASPTPTAVVAGEAPAGHVGDTEVEGWLGCNAPDRTVGRTLRYSKQDMRDSYWGGYCERAQLAAQPSQLPRRLTPDEVDALMPKPDPQETPRYSYSDMRKLAAWVQDELLSSTPTTPEPQQPDWHLRSRVADLLHLLSFAKIETPTAGDADEAQKAMADIRAKLRTQPPEPAPLAVAGDEPSLDAIVDAYLDEYEMVGESESGRDASYTPSETESGLIKDAFMGLLEDEDFRAWNARHVARLAQFARVAMSPMTDALIVQIAEDLGVIGPRSRVGDLHTRIGPFARAVEAHHGIPQPEAPTPQGGSNE